MIGRFLMWLFGRKQDGTSAPIAQLREERVETLRTLERLEREAVRKVVHESARAAIEADKAGEKAEEISRHISSRSGDGSIQTADDALRWLEREGKT